MFAGIDCSTQSFKIQLIDESRNIVAEEVVNYDQDLPRFMTTNGIIRHESHGFDHISTPTLLFIEAFELVVTKLSANNDLSKIKAISGSGQQHGSVWWKIGSSDLLNELGSLDPSVSLCDHFKTAFSKPLSPIWMDSSTSIECKEITESIGCAKKLAEITGSHAYERFTGPQIKHIFKHDPEIYEITEHISLISSFLPSLLCGKYMPIDLSDGSGMNILNIHTHKWDPHILDIIAPNLKEKLSRPAMANEKFRFIASYWCKKYGFSPQCQIFLFSGDNPCSLVGLGLNKSGDIGISLGTSLKKSDTVFAVTSNPTPHPTEGSILIHPDDVNAYMMMLCYKNGSNTRKFIKETVFEKDASWTKFNEALIETPVGNNGSLSFYYIETEITPRISKCGIVKFDKHDNRIEDISINKTDCRGIIETQVLSYKYHAKLLGFTKINSITVTGGGSVNKEILQVIADVFESDVCTSNEPNLACTGAAWRALNFYYELNGIEKPDEVVKEKHVIKPRSFNSLIYRDMFERYEKLEETVVGYLNMEN